MAVPHVTVSQDNKGKGRMNESTIKQELEDEGHDGQVRLLNWCTHVRTASCICMSSLLQEEERRQQQD